jgi:hypothetical protein
MDNTDLGTQFQAICKKAELAQEKIDDAGRNELRTEEAGSAKASDTADHRVRANTVQDQGSEPLQELRDTWRTHVAKARKDRNQRRADLDASKAVLNAGQAESYAREAIEFALDAINDAEEAVLDALQVRASANALVADQVCAAHAATAAKPRRDTDDWAER